MDNRAQGVYAHFADIPCLEWNPPGEAAATIILYHGWGSSIGSYSFFASLLAVWGYRVIVPELPHHGERGQLDYADAAVLEGTFWEIVRQGVKETGEIAALMSRSGGRIGMLGHSTGGFIAAGALARYPQMETAIVINGSCAWIEFEESYRRKFGRPPMTAADKSALARHDPLSRLGFEDGKSLLLLHGKEDTTVPIDSQRFFMAAKSDIPPGRLQMAEYSGVNHLVTLGMLQRSKEWLDEKLGAPAI